MHTDEVDEIQRYYDDNHSLRDCMLKFDRCMALLKKYLKVRTQSEASAIKNRSRVKSENVVSWRKRTKVRLVEYKGGKCVRCGYSKCIQALQFHHRDPSQKDFQISGSSKSFETLKREVDKCDLVCSNCHSEIHAETNVS